MATWQRQARDIIIRKPMRDVTERSSNFDQNASRQDTKHKLRVKRTNILLIAFIRVSIRRRKNNIYNSKEGNLSGLNINKE